MLPSLIMDRSAESSREVRVWLTIAVTEGLSWIFLGAMSYFIPWNTVVLMARPLSSFLAWLLDLIPHYLTPHAIQLIIYGFLMTMVSVIPLASKSQILGKAVTIILGVGSLVPMMWIWIPDPAFMLCAIALMRDCPRKDQ